MAQDVTLEVAHTLNRREIHLARMACSLYDVSGVERALLDRAVFELSLDVDRPDGFAIVPGRLGHGALHPDIELQQLGIRLEELS